MPEGHVIHRLANTFQEDFADHEVRVSSPQGRFADEAAALDGHILTGAEAVGKHLFINFDVPGANRIHIHLGLIGKLGFAPVAEPVGQRGWQWCCVPVPLPWWGRGDDDCLPKQSGVSRLSLRALRA